MLRILLSKIECIRRLVVGIAKKSDSAQELKEEKGVTTVILFIFVVAVALLLVYFILTSYRFPL